MEDQPLGKPLLGSDTAQIIQEFREKNPRIAEALDAFNITYEKYEEIVCMQTGVRTYVTNHSLLPGERA